MLCLTNNNNTCHVVVTEIEFYFQQSSSHLWYVLLFSLTTLLGATFSHLWYVLLFSLLTLLVMFRLVKRLQAIVHVPALPSEQCPLLQACSDRNPMQISPVVNAVHFLCIRRWTCFMQLPAGCAGVYYSIQTTIQHLTKCFCVQNCVHGQASDTMIASWTLPA